jgi:hypothetical protein
VQNSAGLQAGSEGGLVVGVEGKGPDTRAQCKDADPQGMGTKPDFTVFISLFIPVKREETIPAKASHLQAHCSILGPTN